MAVESQDSRAKAGIYQDNGECGLLDVWRDGLYRVHFAVEGRAVEESGEALVVLREGSIFGSDKFGGVFEGQLVVRPSGRGAGLRLQVRVPPGGVLVTGKRVGFEECVVDVSGELSHEDQEFGGICELLGERLVVKFRYIGILG
ncbi:MAG: hypothetical protein KJ622_01255 [Alphaproteobacteria bacterium]|nr:hypothetical protein [Alphaproteobacteria bacterium]